MPPPSNRFDTLRTLSAVKADNALAAMFVALVTGSFLVGFVRMLGGNDLWIGLVTAVPSLMGLLQIPGAIWGRGFSEYKRFIGIGGGLWRILHIPLIFLPFLPLPNELRLMILLLSIALASAATHTVNPIYNDWLAEIVPASSRGWFFSRRNLWQTVASASIGLVGALALDYLKSQGQEKLGYALVFGMGLVCAALSWVFFTRMDDLPRENVVKVNLKEGLSTLKGPFIDKRFRVVLVFLGLFVLGQMFGGNLFAAYALETLHLPFTLLQLSPIAIAMGSLAAIRLWGYLADKYGNKPILALLGLNLSLTPLYWLLCRPDQHLWNTIVLTVGHIYSGVIWSGVNVCQFNLILGTAREEERANYIGVALAVQVVVTGLSPMIGATMMQILRTPLGAEQAYHAVFITVGVLRLFGILSIIPVREDGAFSLKRTLRQLGKFSPRGFRALQDLRHSSDIATRERAMESVADTHFSLATEELIQALHDPAPRIRRQAAVSLARLQDSRAVEALVHQLVDHPDLVEEETVEALGDLQHESAVEALVPYLQSLRPLLRRSAAKALGRIGSPAAVEPLIRAAGHESDADLRRAALQALRILGAREAEPVILHALLENRPSVRIAAAEAVSELDLKEAAPLLRESLARYDDEAQSELAYALGCVGTAHDVPLILGTASKCVSMITRRRCLLGLARMLGVEGRVYRLMMLEGIARETALMNHLKSAKRSSKKLRAALELHSAGREQEAVETLMANHPVEALRLLKGQRIDELFLLAACAWLEARDREIAK